MNANSPASSVGRFLTHNPLRLAILLGLSTPVFAASHTYSVGTFGPASTTAPATMPAGDTLDINNGGFKYFDGSVPAGGHTVFTNQGVVNWNTNSLYLQAGAVINNQSLWDAKGNDTLVNNGGGMSTFNNTGTFRKSAGAGTTSIGSIAFVNSGIIDAQTGTINFSGGNVTFNAGTSFIGSGANVVSSNAVFNGAISSANLALNGGTFTGGAAVLSGTTSFKSGEIAGIWEVASGQMLRGEAGTFKYLSAATLTNKGTFEWATTGGLYLQSAGNLANQGLFDFQENATIYNNGGAPAGGTFTNTGTVRAASGKTGTVSSIAFVNNAGTLEANGTLEFSGGNTTFNTGTAFAGTGINRVSSNANFNGAIASANLELNGGTFTGGAAVLSGTTDFASGYFSGNWELASGHVLNGNNGTFKYVSGAATVLTNKGTVQWNTTGGLYLEAGANVSNQGTFDFLENASLYSNPGSGTFTNTGTVRAAGGKTGTVTSIVFINNGGTLEANGTLLFNGGNTTTFNTGTTFTGSGVNRVSKDASFNGAISSANLELNGGTFTGGAAVLSGTTDFASGYFSGNWELASGHVLNGNNGTFKYVSGAATVLTNKGTVQWNTTGGLYLEAGANVSNQGTFNFLEDASFYANPGSGTFTNTGTVRVAGGKTGTVTSIAFINNGGTLEANGTLLFNGSGTTTFNTGTAFTGSGVNRVSKDASFNGAISSANLELDGGTFTGGAAVLSGTTNFKSGYLSGNWEIASGATLNGNNGGTKYLSAATVTNRGTVQWTSNSGLYLEKSSTLDNRGLFDLQADASFYKNDSVLPASTITNSGTFRKSGGVGTSQVQVPFSNSGTVEANVGTLYFSQGVTGTTGTINTAPGAAVTLAASSTTGALVNNGTLNLGTDTLTVHSDYNNANFGTGNSFNRRANVTTSGAATPRLLAAGDANQGVSGAGVTNGGTTTPTVTVGNVRVGTTTVSYNIDNIGTSGPSLRGAIQTNVNGANLTDPRLSGSGVTAGNWGPVATGTSLARDVTLTVASAGLLAPLVGQSVNILNNFENTRSQLLSITSAPGAAAYNVAAAGTVTPNPVLLANQRVGGSTAGSLTISNTAPAGAFTEGLNASFGPLTGAAQTNSGSVSLLAGGASNNTAMALRVDTTTAGAKSGTAQINLASDGTGTSGLALLPLASQVVTVSGDVYRPAVATLGTIDFGNVLVGSSPTQFLNVSNSAAADGFSEGLNAAFGTLTNSGAGLLTPFGAITNLAAGASDNTTMGVTLSTSLPGTISANVQVLLNSNGATTSGLGLLALSDQNVAIGGLITATVGNLASASAATPNPVNFGNVRVGTAVVDQALAIANTRVGPGEGLNASISTATPGLTATGSFTSLAPPAPDTTSLVIGMDTATAGSRNGTATIALASDGTFNGGVTTPLPSQTINVTGGVYRLADGSVAPASVVVNAREGGTASAALTVSNIAAADGYSEGLRSSAGSTTGDASVSGSTGLIAAGANGAGITVSLNTTTPGAKAGTALINHQSDGLGTSGLGLIGAGSDTVNISGDVYRAAVASALPSTVNLGTVRTGTVVDTALSIANTAGNTGGYTETLGASFGASSAGLTGLGSVSGLAHSAPASNAMSVRFTAGAVGSYAGTAGLDFVSQEINGSGLGTLALASQSVNVNAIVNALAQFGLVNGGGFTLTSGGAYAAMLDFGTIASPATLTTAMSSLNSAIGPADSLAGTYDLSGLTGTPFVLAGSSTFNLAAGGTSPFQLDFSPTTAGLYTGTIVVNLASRNPFQADLALPSFTLTLRGELTGGTGGTVPDSGSTAVLLCLGFIGLVSTRRVLRRA